MRWIPGKGGTLVAVLAGALALSMSADSLAGDLRFNIEYTNMTPNELSDEASKLCSNRLKAGLRATYSNLNRFLHIGETARRKQAGPKGEDDFMRWGTAAVPLDCWRFAVLADCRPEEQKLDVLLVTDKTSVVFQLRDQPLSDARIRWLAEDITARASIVMLQ